MNLSRKSTGDPEAKTVSKEVTVINKLGVHARPAAMFVKTANKFTSDITVERDGEQVDGKSIMGLMMLAAGQGCKLIITAKGSDAEVAVRELELLFQRKFGEE
jgi:phosphocarrier protein HPr